MTLFFLIAAGFSAGFVDAIAGGGGLISLPAFLAIGLPPYAALGTNKIVGLATAFASSNRYRFSGLLSWRRLSPLFAAAMALAWLGAFTATHIDPQILRPVILVLLVAAALLVAFRDRLGLKQVPERFRIPLTWVLFPLIGFYDGFFGPGTGTFMMITFLFVAGLDLLRASAQSRVVNLASNVGALLWFIPHGDVRFQLALPAAIASFVGGILGASLAVRRGPSLIRPVFMGVTWALILKVAWDLFA
ncbi:MAG: TSUP family transporter [Pseudomonadota bacterium]